MVLSGSEEPVKRTRKRKPKSIFVHQMPSKIPRPDQRTLSFAWCWFLTCMNQAQVDSLRFGVNPYDDAEWNAFVGYYRLNCQKPPEEHPYGTVFPLTAEELRDRLRNH